MEIIDLYFLIYKRNEMPELIKYDGIEYKWNEVYKDYMAQGGLLFLHNRTPFDLDDTVEILEKENKIPEKLPEWATSREDKEYTNLEYQVLEVARKVDEIIDYLKNKGEII